MQDEEFICIYGPDPERVCDCGFTCISCSERRPEFDTPDGPFCEQCIGNGQYSLDHEVVERDVRDHTCPKGAAR